MAIATLLCANAFAQSAEKTWRWTIEAEGQAGEIPAFGVGGTFGYQFNQRLYAGLGSDILLTIDGIGLNIPIFAVAKFDMLKQQNTPIVDLRGGINIDPGWGIEGFGSAALGYKFKGEKAVVCPAVGWIMQEGSSMVLRFTIEF